MTKDPDLRTDSIHINFSFWGHRQIFGSAQINFRCEKIFRLKTRLDSLQTQEAINHQTGSDKQYERQSHFDHYQSAPSAVTGGPGRRSSSFFECFIEIRVRRLPGWSESK